MALFTAVFSSYCYLNFSYQKPFRNPLPSLLGIKLLVDRVCQCTNSVDWILFRHLDSQNITKQRHLDVQGLMAKISNEHVAISPRIHQTRSFLLPKRMTRSNKSTIPLPKIRLTVEGFSVVFPENSKINQIKPPWYKRLRNIHQKCLKQTWGSIGKAKALWLINLPGQKILNNLMIGLP